MDNHIILEEEAIAGERESEAAHLGNAITRQAIRALPTLREPICVSSATSVGEAISKMNEHRIGCLLVVESERLVGVFTERDVLTKIVGHPEPLDTLPVGQVMTRDPEYLTLDDGIAYALNKMSIGGFRHIPLVDDDGRPTGVVAMRTIVEFIVDLFPEQVLNLPPSPSHRIVREREGA